MFEQFIPLISQCSCTLPNSLRTTFTFFILSKIGKPTAQESETGSELFYKQELKIDYTQKFQILSLISKLERATD